MTGLSYTIGDPVGRRRRKAALTLTCSFGISWATHFPIPCLWCQAEGERLRQIFDQQVRDGVYDREGFTALERKALARSDHTWR